MNKYNHINELGKLNNQSTKEDVLLAFKNIKSFYRNTILIDKGAYIYRTRFCNLETNAINSNELSYNRHKDKIEIGRCNPKGYQVFYGCTHKEFKKELQSKAQLTSILETSEFMPSKKEEPQTGYLSRWRLTKELLAFQLFNFDFGSSTDPFIRLYKESGLKMIDEMSPIPERDKEINMWLATQFAEKFDIFDTKKYEITSMMSIFFLENNCDAIIYPTVQGNGVTLNVALNAKAADTLQLEYVTKFEINIKNDIRETKFLQDTSKIVNGNIQGWKKL